MNCLFDALFAKAAPTSPFLIMETGALSYGEALDETGRLGNALRALGVKPGDRVAAQVEKSPRALLLYMACVRIGAIYLPLNTAYTLAELRYFIEDAAPSLIVCDPAKREGIEAFGLAAVATLDRLGEGSLAEQAKTAPIACEPEPRAPEDLAAILYTSGTTGRSKGAMLSHANLLSNADTLVSLWGFTDKDVLIHALPIYHTHGLFVATNILMRAGGAMIFRPKFDPAECIALMPAATALMGVPTFYTRLLDQPGLDREAAKSMRLFISGSAPLLAETHRQFEARTGCAILERYGMTETNMNTSNPLNGARIPGTVGLPLPDVALRVADPETGALLPQGEIGVIEVKGPNVFKGYWRNPEKTAAEFRADGFFITGDLGRVDENGYVNIVGRGKDLIISGGFNVYPKEVETEIDALEGVVESAVIAAPHKDFGEAVVAVVACGPERPLTEEQVLAALADRLAKFKQPKRVIFVDDLPRNAMGKVQKAALRETYKGLFA